MVMEPLCQWWGSPDSIRVGRCLLEQPAGCCPHGDRKTCGVSLFCSTEKPRFGFGRWVSCAEFGFHRGWTQSCSSSSHETHRALEQGHWDCPISAGCRADGETVVTGSCAREMLTRRNTLFSSSGCFCCPHPLTKAVEGIRRL